MRHQHLEGHLLIGQMGYGISFVPILGDNFTRIYRHDRNWHSIFFKLHHLTTGHRAHANVPESLIYPSDDMK
jgi:hypothetical protein